MGILRWCVGHKIKEVITENNISQQFDKIREEFFECTREMFYNDESLKDELCDLIQASFTMLFILIRMTNNEGETIESVWNRHLEKMEKKGWKERSLYVH